VNFNEEELLKIEKATSGWLKKSDRKAISEAISALRPKIQLAQNILNQQQKHAELVKLVDEATATRHRALHSGGNSYGHPAWAAAAVCESWLQELVLGTPESISRVENMINKLENR
jgi:hypothetical protein